jgi:4-alpha-glucanotransferase
VTDSASQGGQRRAGVLIPLFVCRSTSSWGIGDIGDLAPTTSWLAAAGQRVLQLLPLNEMAPGQQSPYSAISAMATDPIYIHVPAVQDFAALGGRSALSSSSQASLVRVSKASCVEYAAVRTLKGEALTAAFERFLECEWHRDSERAGRLRTFLSDQGWWIDNYALFRAIHAREEERPWFEWPEPLTRRDPDALERARRELSREVLFYEYLQWLADDQWHVARAHARAAGVALFGDLPFMVDADSADVWGLQDDFRLDVSVGVPPDAFSATGQDWGMPLYDWPALAADDFRWLRARARRSADLYDGYRVDHLVGFYRTYGRPRAGGRPFFTPADQREQVALGERVLSIFREPGSEIVAEDLGTVPDFVRESLARLGVPGFRVLRWEREWQEEGQPFREPRAYPSCSVATSGTHDTETMAVWWKEAPDEDKRDIQRLETVRQLARGADLTTAPFNPTVRDVLLEALFASGSDLLLLPVQDLFGWLDRINQPATVADTNWCFRLPWPIDRLDDLAEARERQATLRRWSGRYQRL